MNNICKSYDYKTLNLSNCTLVLYDNIVSKPGIYCILNTINNKLYIGSSSNLKRRKMFHFSRLSNNKHFNNHLQNAWNKYGELNFKFYIIDLYPQDDLEVIEEKYIKMSKSSDILYGYNKTDKCVSPPLKGVKGKDHPMFGVKRSQASMEPARIASRGSNNYASREVCQMDENEKVINTFGCIADAARHIMKEVEFNKSSNCSSKNVKTYSKNIGTSCKNYELKRKYAGYLWKYSTVAVKKK